jgi:hypothetical protein
MTLRAVALLLIAAGLVLNQYGFLHDILWGKHAGAIYMGVRTYALVAVGLATIILGAFLLWRRSES